MTSDLVMVNIALWNPLLLELFWIFSKLYTYITGLLKMYMWNFDAEQIFLYKMTAFLT